MDKVNDYVGLITLLFTVVSSFIYIISRFSKIEMKVDLLWKYIMDKALSEVVIKGFGTLNSPLKVTPEIKKLFDDTNLSSELKTFYLNNCLKMSDDDIFAVIVKNFGSKINDQICKKNNINYDIGITLGVAIAKDVKI